MANLFQAWDEDIQALGAAKASDDQIEARRQQLAEHFKAKAKAAGLSSKKIYETLDQFDAYSRQNSTAQDDQLTPEEQEMTKDQGTTLGFNNGALKEVGKRFKDVGLGAVSSLTRMGGDVAQTWADVGDNDKSELSSQIAQGLYNATDDIRSNYSEGTKQAKKDFWSPAGLTMGVSENLGQIAGSATVFGAAGKLAAARKFSRGATLLTAGTVGAPLAYSQGYGQGKENSLDEINKTSNAQLWENVKAEAKAYDDAGGTGEVPYLVKQFKEAGGDLNLMKDLMAENAGNVTGLMTVGTEPLAMGVGSLMSRGAAIGGTGARAGLVNSMNNQGMSNELARRIAAGGSAGIASQVGKIGLVQGMRGTGQEGIQEGGEGFIAKTEGSLAAGRKGELTGEDWRGEHGIIQQGLQGAAIGGIMAGGSVYSTARNASKLALEKNGLPEKHDAAIIAKEQADAVLAKAANIADANPNNMDAKKAYADAQDAAWVATNDLEQLTGKFNALYTPEEQAVIKAATMEGVAARKKVADDAAKAQKELDDAQAKEQADIAAQQAEAIKAQRDAVVNNLAGMVGDDVALSNAVADLGLSEEEANSLLDDAHKVAKKQKKEAAKQPAPATATPKTPFETAVDEAFNADGTRNPKAMTSDIAKKHNIPLKPLVDAISERIDSNSAKNKAAANEALAQKRQKEKQQADVLSEKQQLENTLADFAANNDHDSMVNFLRDYEPTEADKLIKNAYASVESKKKAEQDAIAATKKAEALKVKESEAKAQAEQKKIAFNQDMANLYAANPDRNPTKAELDSVGKKHGVKSPIELAQAWVKAKNEAKAAKEAAPKLALPSPKSVMVGDSEGNIAPLTESTLPQKQRNPDLTVPTGLNINRDNIENQDRRPIIVRSNGQPFQTQEAAEQALKNKSTKKPRKNEAPITPETHEVIPVDGGFAIAPVVEIQQPKKPDDNEDGGVIADSPKPNAPVSPSGGTIPRVHLDRIGRLLKEGKTVEEIATKIQKSLPNLSIEYVTQQVLAAQEKASKPATLDSVIGKYSDDEEVDAGIRQSGEVLKQFLPETIDDWKIDKSTFAVRGAWSVSYTKPYIVTDSKTGKEVVNSTTKSAPLDGDVLLSGDEQAIKDHIKERLTKNGITPRGVKNWQLDDAVSPAGQQAVSPTGEQVVDVAPTKPVEDDGIKTKHIKQPKPVDRVVYPDRDNLLTAIAKLKGLDRDDVIRQMGLDRADYGKRAAGLLGVFKKDGTGLSLDAMATTLSGYGYPVNEGGNTPYDNINGTPTPDALLDALRKALFGEDVGTEEYILNKYAAQREADQKEAEEMERLFNGKGSSSWDEADALDNVSNAIVDDIVSGTSGIAPEKLSETLKEVSNEPIIETSGQTPNAKTEARSPQNGDAETTGNGKTGQQESQSSTGQDSGIGLNPSFNLNAQTNEELARRDAENKAAEAKRQTEEKAAKDKTQADKEVSDFRLSGSNAPADVAMAGGQKDMFAPPTRGEREAEKAKQEPTKEEPVKWFSTQSKADEWVAKQNGKTFDIRQSNGRFEIYPAKEQPQGNVIAKKGIVVSNAYGSDGWRIISDVKDTDEMVTVIENENMLSERKLTMNMESFKERLKQDAEGRKQYQQTQGKSAKQFTYKIKQDDSGKFYIQSDNGGGVVLVGKPKGFGITAISAWRMFDTKEQAKKYLDSKGMTEDTAQDKSANQFGTRGEAIKHWIANNKGVPFEIVESNGLFEAKEPAIDEDNSFDKRSKVSKLFTWWDTGKMTLEDKRALLSKVEAITGYMDNANSSWNSLKDLTRVELTKIYDKEQQDKSAQNNEPAPTKQPETKTEPRSKIDFSEASVKLEDVLNKWEAIKKGDIVVTKSGRALIAQSDAKGKMSIRFKVREGGLEEALSVLNVTGNNKASKMLSEQLKKDTNDALIKKLIGKTPEGKDLYEDGRGVRFTDNGRGVQLGEDVAITMQNGKTVYDVSGRTDEHRTVEEVAARQPKQPTKKESLLIKIDDELDAALDDLAAIFKDQGNRLSSGVDPVIMGKVLAIGMKASTLYLAKGAVKFSIWAENMIASLSSKGVSQDLVEPYLKGLYAASKMQVSPEIRKQMDKEDDVYDFDFATLNVGQEETKPVTGDLVEDDVYDENNLDAENGTDGWKYGGYIFGDDDVSHSIGYREIRKTNNGTQSTIQQIRIYNDNRASYMAVWENESSKITDGVLDGFSIDTAKFHFSMSDATEAAFGEDATNGDALWASFGSEITDSIKREMSREAKPNKKPVDKIGLPAPKAKETLTDLFYKHLKQGTLPENNASLRKLVAEFDGKEVDNYRLKEAQEMLEAAIARHSRDVVASNHNGDASTFNQLVDAYNKQPNLNIRTSTSIENQAYSTPAPLAFVAAKMANIGKNTTVYEPTAGNGMLLITALPENATVNEMESTRFNNLKDQGFNAHQGDALKAIENGVVKPNSQDAIITNPPFGSIKENGKTVKVAVDGYKIGKIDHLIAVEALKAMKPNGTAAIIIGADMVQGGISTDDRIFFNWLYANYNVVGHFEVDGKLYSRQGASWPVRVIIVHGKQASDKNSPVTGAIPRYENWKDVYDQYTKMVVASNNRGLSSGTSGTNNTANDTRTPQNVDGVETTQTGTGGRNATRNNDDVDGTSTRNVSNRSGNRSKQLPVSDNVQRFDERTNAQDNLAVGDNRDTGVTTGNDSRSNRGSVVDGNTRSDVAVLSDADNSFQVKYTPASSRKDEGVLIPINMRQPLMDSLLTLEDNVGDIDKYAAKELGYRNTEQLHDALMGLQVDSVASAIYQIKEKNKGIIIADQTGIGKGRQAAAIIRWAMLNGHTPVFVTVKPQLFTDMYGDLSDIGSNDVKPFIVNTGESISGKDGKKLHKTKPDAKHRKEVEDIAGDGVLPDDYNAVFITYSQINKTNNQQRLLSALSGNAIFILDESHNAGGASSTGMFMQEVLKEAKGVVYLSATFAKRPDNMPLYFKTDMGLAVGDTNELSTAVMQGGLPLQTVISNALVKAGQLFRRERSYNGVSIETKVDSANKAEHEKLSDEATKALRAIVAADRMFHNTYFAQLEKAVEEQGMQARAAGNKAEKSVNHHEFSSVVHNFIRQMLLGLKVDTAANDAIAALKRGEKPVIALENTMGSFLNEYVSANGLKDGDSLGDFGYRDVLSRALHRTRAVTIKDKKGEETRKEVGLHELDSATRAAYDAAQKIIDSLDVTIPASPIDWMRSRIEKAGYTVAEITGRNTSVDYSTETPTVSQVPLSEQNDKVGTTRMFNSGELDAIILNVAGSTGISLHASEKFKDQRVRHMIVAQPAQDINIFMQMLGRIHRTGQVVLPKYTILSLDLPTEKRPTAVLNKKMKSLNANTSSNTESATSIISMDMLNKYGDKVVAAYLSENQDIAKKIGMEVHGDASSAETNDDFAKKATGRFALLPIQEQNKIYEEIEPQYAALISYLDETGQNELEPKTIDFEAELKLESTAVPATDPSTPFGQEAIYGEYKVKPQGKPMSVDEVKALIIKNIGEDVLPSEHTQKLITEGQNGFNSFIANLEKKYQEAKDEEEAGNIQKNISNQNAVFSNTKAFIESHRVGSIWQIDIKGDIYNAVITNIKSTFKKGGHGNPFAQSKILISLAVNGELRSVTVPMTEFSRIEVTKYYGTAQDALKQRGDDSALAKIITGNLLAAYANIQGSDGRVISFTKKDGSVEQGILLPKKFNFKDNVRQDFAIKDANDVFKLLKSGVTDILKTGVASRKGDIRIIHNTNTGGITIYTPKAKTTGGKWFLDKKLIGITGDFVSNGNTMMVSVPSSKAVAALSAVINKSPLYVLPSQADATKELLGYNDGQVNLKEDKPKFSRKATESDSVPIYRIDNKNFDANNIKPHGLYVSIPSDASTFDSPHKDVGDTSFAGNASPKNPLNVESFKIQHKRGNDYPMEVSAGVSALKQLVSVQLFERLIKVDKAELTATIKEQFPDIDTSQYYDAYELLEVLGAQLAIQEGYDAIIQKNGNDPFNEMVILDNSIIESMSPTDKPKNSKGTGEGLTTTQTRAILVKHFGEKLIKALESIGLLTIMATPPSWAKPDADGAYHNGKAYLFTDNLSAETVVATLAHELSGHKGFQGLMTPTAYDSLMRQFNRLVKQGNAIALAAKARAEAAESTLGAQQDEYLPYLLTQQATLNATRSQQSAVTKVIEQVYRAVKAWLYRTLSAHGFDGVASKLLQPKDITLLAERMIREMGNGTNPSNNTKAKGSQFSQLNTPQTQINAVRKKYEGTSQWMKAPNGQPTKLNEMQWLQVRTPNFKAWFGDWENDAKNASKVVDSETKEPMVVYHGTPNDFSEFAKEKQKEGDLGKGFYFTDNKANASSWSRGGNVMPVFLTGTTAIQAIENGNPAKSRNLLISKWRTSNVFVATNPTQIKSATDNNGEFSPTNPDIRFSRKAKNPITEGIKSAANDTTSTVEALDKFNKANYSDDIRFSKTEQSQFERLLAKADKMIAEQGQLLAPNGKPSKLNRVQWAQVRTPNFKAWFGDFENDPANASKVVDENGEPLVVYHGTEYGGFTEFGSSGYGAASREKGFWFSNKIRALEYSGKNQEIEIVPVLKSWSDAAYFAKKLDVEFKKAPEDEYDDGIYFIDDDIASTLNQARNILQKAIEDKQPAGIYPVFLSLKTPKTINAKGKLATNINTLVMSNVPKKYDGMMIVDVDDAGRFGDYGYITDNYVAKTSTQIKSAIGNNGEFNPTNPDIRFSRTEQNPRSSSLDNFIAKAIAEKAWLTTEQINLLNSATTFDELIPLLDKVWNQYFEAKKLKNNNSTKTAVGVDNIKSLIRSEVDSGHITKEHGDLALYFAEKNPALFDSLKSFSFQNDAETLSGNAVGGVYNVVDKVIRISRRTNGSQLTIAHEVLHHAEEFLPENIKSSIIKAWQNDLIRAFKSAENGSNRKTMLHAIIHSIAMGDMSAIEKAIDSMDGVIPANTYHLFNPSEYWAENASRLMNNRSKRQDTWIENARSWINGLIQTLKNALGLQNDAAILKGLRMVLSGSQLKEGGKGIDIDHVYNMKMLNLFSYIGKFNHDGANKTKTSNEKYSRQSKNPITEGIKSAANDAKNSLPDPIAKSIDNFMAGRILPSSDMANITAKTELSIYKRTIGTQLNTALQLPDFKKVYDMAQRYLQHVAVDAYAALKVAPNLLGKLESWSDLKKDVKKIWPANFIKQKADRAAVASIIFDETLNNELLSDADILKALTRDQRQIYKEARDAIQVSLENTAKSEMVRKLLAAEAINWQTVESLINQDLPVGQFAQAIRDLVESRIGGFKNELEAILDADPKIKEAFKTGNKNKLIPAQKKELKKAKTLKAQIETTEEALKSLNDVENRLGTLIEQGYAPLMRFGEYTLTVRDLDGKVKSFFMFESKAEQVRATNAIVARYGKTVNLETDMISKEEFKQFAGMTPETMALFAKETGMDKDEAYQHYLKLAIPARSAMTRMIKRKGTEGFSDDIQRVVASFVMSNARMSAKNIYAAQIEKSIQAIESGKSVKDQAYVMKENVFNPKENFAQLRNFLFLWNLGGSIFFGLLNMTQPYMQTLPHLSQYVPIKEAFYAIIKGSGIAGSAMKNGTAPKGYEAEYNRAVREGVVDPQNVFMLSGVERGKTGASNSAWGVITHTMGLIAQVTESFNRKAVFIASLQVAKQKGDVWLKKKGFNSAYDFAKDSVDQTQGVYDKANRSNWANTSVGAPLMVFKQFSINYVEQVVRMWKKEAASGDEGKKAVFLMLAMLASLSGMMGLPFIKDFLDVSETTAAFLGHPVNLEREARLMLGKDIADPLFNGVLNHFVFNQLGMDIQSRTGMPDLVPWSNALNPTLSAQGRINEFASIAGATGGLIEKGYDATQLIARGNIGTAALTLMPRSITSAFTGGKMAVTDEVMDSKGNKLFDTTWDEGLVKFIDANPKRMADLSRTKSLEWKDFAIQDYMTTSFKQKIIAAMMDKDQAEVNKLMKEVEVWNNARSRYPVYINLNTLAENANKKDQTFDAREKIRKGMTWVKNERPEM